MQSSNQIIIIGAGGHGKVVLSTLLAMGETIFGFVDDNPKLIGTQVGGYKVLGNLSLLNDRPNQAVIFGIGNNSVRKKLAYLYRHLHWKIAIHPTAHVHET